MALLTAVVLSACKPAATEPVFEEAWIRSLPPGVKMTAGFGVLKNETAQDIEITGFSSPAFRDVSLHETVVIEGVSKMQKVESLAVASGESVELAPGGYHLMLMLPKASISPGRTIPLEITAADGRTFTFDVPVENR
jgi:copper(I)-binding protein